VATDDCRRAFSVAEYLKQSKAKEERRVQASVPLCLSCTYVKTVAE